MTYSYDRTAAENQTAEAIKWYVAERKKVIDKALKAMGKDLERVMAEGKQKFPNADEEKLTNAIREREQKIRDRLQG